MLWRNTNVRIAGLVSIVLVIGYTGGVFHTWQEKLTDTLFSSRPVSGHIVVVAIDEQSIQNIGQWPWPRAEFGRLIDRLDTASVIGIDVNFKEPSRLGLADDRVLVRSIERSSADVVLTSELQPDGTIILPVGELSNVGTSGYPNFTVAPDGVIRTTHFLQGAYQSFSLRIATLFANHDESVRITSVPSGPTRIVYRGPNRTFPSVSAYDVLRRDVPDEVFRDAIILIGATTLDLQDYHATPFGIVSGVEIQAHAVETLLTQQFLKHLPVLDIALIIILAGLGAWLVAKFERIDMMVGSILGIAIFYILVTLLAFDRFLVLDILYPSISLLATASISLTHRYLSTKEEKRFIQTSFGRYLAPQVIEELLLDPSKLSLGGKKVTLSILFSDIRSFTTLSESMSPEQLTSFLNRYLTRMSDIILEHRGVIDKYIGDAVMTFWGAPLPDELHATHAVESAREMIRALKIFNAETVADGFPPIAVGIGINSGEVTVGNMGSEKRFDYTVLGDNVNLASRLESLTKQYGVHIIISENTARQLEREAKAYDIPPVLIREIDRVQVKGKTSGVTIYEVATEDTRDAVTETLDAFNHARDLYYAGSWDEAIQELTQLLARTPGDGPTKLLLERAQEFSIHSPESWSGVYEMKTK